MSTLGNHEEYTERGEGRGNGGTNMLHIEPYLTMTTSRATKPHGNEDLGKELLTTTPRIEDYNWDRIR